MPTIDLNLFIKAPTQYTNVPFNSYANFDGINLGVSSGGLYQVCCGDSDDDSNIDSYFEIVKTDFGIHNPKRLRYVYVGFRSDEDLTLTVQTDTSVAKSYTLKANKNRQQRSRVTIDRGAKGRYWSIKIANKTGYDFSIDFIHVLPIVLSEGFK